MVLVAKEKGKYLFYEIVENRAVALRRVYWLSSQAGKMGHGVGKTFYQEKVCLATVFYNRLNDHAY